MLRSDEAGARAIAQNCNLARSGRPRYGDRGLWCTLWYQMSGDQAAARTAWRQAAPSLTAPPASANQVREELIENAILFDWLYPALSDAERQQAVDGLNAWSRFALAIGTPQYRGGLRPADSDALVGYYFGLVLADLASCGMPGHVAWRDAQQENPVRLRVGGFHATPNALTARNALADLIRGPAAGGEWPESSEYNMGTLALLGLGVAAVRGAAGDTLFPEADRFLDDAARVQLLSVSTDLRQAMQWGDNEHPRGFADRLFRRRTLLGILAGTVRNDTLAARLRDLSNRLVQRHGASGFLSAEAWPRYYLLHDPFAPTAEFAEGNESWYAEGMGSLYVRHDADLFWAAMHPWPGVDHALNYLADFQLYRHGEWVITRPMGYAGPAVEAAAANGVLLSGHGAMARKGPLRHESGPGWWAVTGATGGPLYATGYWDPPPAFVEEWQRTIVYLRHDGVDQIVTVDWVDMRDPAELPKLDRYRGPDRSRIEQRQALLQWVLHTPIAPRETSLGWEWATRGGQPVVVSTVGGATERADLVQESELWRGAQGLRPQELAWQLRLTPDYRGGPIVMRHVITVGDRDPPVPRLDGDTIVLGGTRVTVGRGGVSVSR